MHTTKDTAFTSGYAGVNGIKMYYEIHGEGKPLVLVHGGGSTIATNYGNILPLFAQHYKVIAMELQAHGRTADRDAPESFEQDADDVAALLQQLGISKPYVLGFSNGGNTTMQLAVRHPELAAKLVIISSFYQREGLFPGFFDMMKTASLDNMPKPLQEGFLEVNPDSAKLLVMHNKDRDRMLAFKNWPDSTLQSIHVPALVMAGDKDVVSVAHTLKMSQLIPNAQLCILPGTHGSFIGEVCSAVPGSSMPAAAIIREFLDK